MPEFLLDTNVFSELARKEPQPEVVTFVAELDNDGWTSVICLHELHFGLAQMPPGKRRTALYAWLSELRESYQDRILLVDDPVSTCAAELRYTAQRNGCVLSLADALIGATARTANLRLATRNVEHFHGLAIDVTNPWPQRKEA